MTSPVFALLLTCLFLGKMAQTTDPKLSSSLHQEKGFVSAKTGENITLRCFYEGGVSSRVYWYKQTLGQKPRLISTFYGINGIFYEEFKNNPRFTLYTETGQSHLNITHLSVSDSATYYCASYTVFITFSEGTLVNVEGSGLKVPATVHQSASESIQPGGSVTLNCTVHTGTCDGEHSVYWFKKSEESQPGLIYTHGGRTDQCERKPNTRTHTCVYKLPMKSLNLSHAGTYYCAVTSCGHILFGDGTKLELEDEVDSPFLVYFLSSALAFTTILSVLLAFLLYKVKKRHRCQTAENHATFPSPTTTSAEGYQDADNVHYAALSITLPNRSRRQRNKTNDECVYSSVKQ
ncbi:immunoglobulin kappa light chain-like isoform X2 [Etheostoma cragini]|uniref:immunoglobulin kappa light chain-like isoform X2 n=1 Tax=Etheostoma cragini TaxID=417921 RepID=UPI00155DF21B|nr:immunoglobulin kappa light chain-like isoform X2 [Etheostoma cragini]